jgi:hypothetical protein
MSLRGSPAPARSGGTGALTLLLLPRDAHSVVAQFLPTRAAAALSHACKDLHAGASELWRAKFSVLPRHIPRPPPALDGDIPALLRAYVRGQAEATGVPAARMDICWGTSPEYWTLGALEPSPPFGKVRM